MRAAAAPQAKGYRTLNFHGTTGTDYPALQDIKKHVLDAGKSETDPAKFGENLYNRGVYNSVLIAEAIRTAQAATGKTVINAEDMRAGLEALDITEERIKEIGLEGFMRPVKVTCEDHNGHHAVYVQEWDGETWKPATDWFEPMTDVVQPLLEAAAAEYVKTNAPWPERTEACASGG